MIDNKYILHFTSPKVTFQQILLVAFVLIAFSGCKTARKTPSKASSGNVREHGKPAKPGAAKPSAYPAINHYGNSWNNEHVRYASSLRPEPASLVLVPEGTHNFVMPVCGKVLSEFGPRSGRMHTGIDIKLQKEDPVYCAFDGMVRMAKDYSGYGKMVVVRHENGLETLYSHLNSIAVKVNQRVKAGDRVGGGGRTGRASTEHLHFEARFKGEPFNPRLLVDFEKCRLTSKQLLLTEASYKQYYKNLKTETATAPPEKKIAAKKTENLKIPVAHIVEKGDTLYSISRRYNTTVDSLRKLNHLSEASTLKVGQKLQINTR